MADNMDALSKELFEEILSVMEEEGLERADITPSTQLKALELSSMQFLRVVGALEDMMGIPLDAGLGEIDTLQDLMDELKKLKEAA